MKKIKGLENYAHSSSNPFSTTNGYRKTKTKIMQKIMNWNGSLLQEVSE